MRRNLAEAEARVPQEWREEFYPDRTVPEEAVEGDVVPSDDQDGDPGGAAVPKARAEQDEGRSRAGGKKTKPKHGARQRRGGGKAIDAAGAKTLGILGIKAKGGIVAGADHPSEGGDGERDGNDERDGEIVLGEWGDGKTYSVRQALERLEDPPADGSVEGGRS